MLFAERDRNAAQTRRAFLARLAAVAAVPALLAVVQGDAARQLLETLADAVISRRF